MFESPHRLQATLSDVFEVCGDRPLCVSRELTKYHEEIFYGKVSDAIVHFQHPLGEFSLVVALVKLLNTFRNQRKTLVLRTILTEKTCGDSLGRYS